jgi:hypothetical protein
MVILAFSLSCHFP